MCFYHDDADWYASVIEHDTLTSDKPVRCDECRRWIPPGQNYQHVFMQQYEGCRVCDRVTREEHDLIEDDDDADRPPCPEGECDYGEQFEHDACEQCQKLLQAIQRVEEDDGCQGAETQPALGELRDALGQSDHAGEYIDRARNDFPELAMSGYLDRMYYFTREWDRFFQEQWDDEDLEPVEELGGEG